MRQVLENTLSLGAKNSVVHAFKKLVYHSLGMTFKSEDKNASNDSSIPPRYIAELDKDLYSKAVSLPEAATVSLDSDIDDKLKYGEFSGGSVYKTLDGDIDENNKDVRAQEGWLILDRSSNDYAIFVAESDTYIIAIKSFTPKPIVKDFMPLYNKLNESIKHSHSTVEDSIKADTKFVDSLAVTYRNDVSDIVTSYTEQEYANTASDSSYGGSSTNDKFSIEFPMLSLISSDLKVKIYKAWLLYMQAVLLYGDLIFFGLSLKDRMNKLINANWLKHVVDFAIDNYANDLAFEYFFHNAEVSETGKENINYGVYPGQIGVEKKTEGVASNNAINEVQAVIYILDPNTTSLSLNYDDYKDGYNILYCFQTPESISYNVQSSYEAVSTRGTQQPLQYYNSASQIDFSFTLKWHIDEVRTLQNSDGISYSLQDIARIAEGYTRPWDTGGGNKGKLCKVILPSIARIGYITSANISYSGDMIGSIHGDVVGSISSGRTQGIDTEYGYNVLEITFNMIVVQDVELSTLSAAVKDDGTIEYSTDLQIIGLSVETNKHGDGRDETTDLTRTRLVANNGISGEWGTGMSDTGDVSVLGSAALITENVLEIAQLATDIASAGVKIMDASERMANASIDLFNALKS